MARKRAKGKKRSNGRGKPGNPARLAEQKKAVAQRTPPKPKQRQSWTGSRGAEPARSPSTGGFPVWLLWTIAIVVTVAILVGLAYIGFVTTDEP